MRVAVCLATRRDGSGLPEGFSRDPARWSAVIVDVLRATSTLTVALANGARAVESFAEPAAAMTRRGSDTQVLACGERDGKIVPGFDLANSPQEYTRDRVEGRTLAFASTNGSLALLATARCQRRTLGAFINAHAVLDHVRAKRPGRLLILCAGKLGRFALEDAAFAGWLCAELQRGGATLDGPDTRLAGALAPRDAAEVRTTVEGSSHARYLGRLGPNFAQDVAFCATLNAIPRAFDV